VVWCNHKRGAIIRCSTPAEHRRASLLISMPGSCSSGGMICPMYFPDRKRGRGGSCSALLVRGGKNKFQSRYGRHNVFRDVDDNAANYTSGSDVPKVRFADHLSVLDYQLEIERGWRFRPVERLFTAFSGSEDRFLGSSLCCWPMSRSRSRKPHPYCSIKNDRRVRTVRTSATIRVNSANSAPVGVRMVAVACSVRQAYFRRCSRAGGPGEKPKTPP
jgi:hypothetical protein